MAEHYRRFIGGKTRDALERRRLQGRRYSRVPPYGFTVAGGGQLEPEPYEQSVLRLITMLLPADLSLRASHENWQRGGPWRIRAGEVHGSGVPAAGELALSEHSVRSGAARP
jgi:hypothetical protein